MNGLSSGLRRGAVTCVPQPHRVVAVAQRASRPSRPTLTAHSTQPAASHGSDVSILNVPTPAPSSNGSHGSTIPTPGSLTSAEDLHLGSSVNGALAKADHGKFVQFFRQASPYIEGHRGRTFVIVVPGAVSARVLRTTHAPGFRAQ